MQTLEPTQVAESESAARRSRVRMIAVASVAAVGCVVVAAAAYEVGRSTSSTKTIVRTVPTPPTAAAPVVDDRGFSKLGNGHQAEAPEIEPPLDSATRLLLQHQLTLARQVAMRYPTVAVAEAAGWRRAGPFVPGLGAHFLDLGQLHYAPTGPITDAAILAPTSLIYDGTRPSSRIAGLMYIGNGLHIPQGFAGDTDIWHYHTNVCLVIKPTGSVDVPFGIDTTVSKALCDGVNGEMLQRTPFMLHTWVVAGYDSPQGVFSHESEAMTCRDGTYNMIPVSEWGTRSSACVDGGE